MFAFTVVGPFTITLRNSALTWPPSRNRTSQPIPLGAPVMSTKYVPSALVIVTHRIGGPIVTQTFATTAPELMSLTVPLSDGSTAAAVPADASSEAATKAAGNRRIARTFHK